MKGYSTLALDKAFSDREDDWELESQVKDEFRETVLALSDCLHDPNGSVLTNTRMRNQADFYSLFAAIVELMREKSLPAAPVIVDRLEGFVNLLSDESLRASVKAATAYYDAARSASNDVGPRRTRIDVLKRVILGQSLADDV